jgi:putative acetyltransferase
MRIRPETAADHAAVARLTTLAFGQAAEARLVEGLRAAGRAAIALVAEDERQGVIGHILFSPVRLDPAPEPAPTWLGLAPMAVLPSYQRRGVGSALVRAGLDAARAAGATAVVVLGHAEYYPRFGFAPASRVGLHCVYDAPEEAFMARALVPGGFGGHRGLVRYAPEFDAL